LLTLLLGRSLPDMALVGVEDCAAQGAELLALVQLTAEPSAELLVGEPVQHEVRLDQPAILLQRLGERVAP
jgi:hypothetical protein